MNAQKTLHGAANQSLSLALRRSAERSPGKVALKFGDEAWTYRDFDSVVDALANGLAALGITKGDRVAIVARNSHAFLAVRFAVARIAAVFVPINVMLSREDMTYILEHSGAAMLFADAEFLAIAREASPSAVRDIFTISGAADGARSWCQLCIAGGPAVDLATGQDLLQIVYTSGTESRPKGAMLTHDAIMWQYQSCLFDCRWSPDDVTLHALPLFHCGALDLMAGPALLAGATGVIISRPDADEICRIIERERVTSFFAPPTVWIGMLAAHARDAYDLSSLIKGYYGASIMPIAVIEQMMQRLPQLQLWNTYGQTEMAPLATLLQPEDHATHIGSAGRPALHVQTRIVDDEMNDVHPGEIGEIVHRSPHLLSGYWNQEDATEQAFAGGWFHTGDLGTMDAEGFLTVVDRKKDMIKSGGENISSREVEEAIYSHAAVSEVAVVGLPDPTWIEAVTAFVVPKDGHTIRPVEILDHCESRLARFKMPKSVVVLSALPKNATGKIVKRRVREEYQAQAQREAG